MPPKSLALVAALVSLLAGGRSAHAIIECNEETVGQPCDTDDTVCTEERCVMQGLSVECKKMGNASPGAACALAIGGALAVARRRRA